VVSKQSDKTGSFSAVHEVQGEQRVSEIARMLGGERLSDTTHAHAREMLSSMTAVASKPKTKGSKA
jgi:DNA repair protein RecN (Recombination protein N)